MKDRSDDPSHNERTLLPRSYISLPLLNKTRQDNIQMFNKSIFSSIEQEKSKIQKQIIQKQICQVAVSIIISNLFVSVALISLVLYLKKDKFYLKFVFIICLII